MCAKLEGYALQHVRSEERHRQGGQEAGVVVEREAGADGVVSLCDEGDAQQRHDAEARAPPRANASVLARTSTNIAWKTR